MSHENSSLSANIIDTRVQREEETFHAVPVPDICPLRCIYIKHNDVCNKVCTGNCLGCWFIENVYKNIRPRTFPNE